MELLILSTEDSKLLEDDELQMVKTGLIFAEKTTLVSYYFKNVVFHMNLYKLSEKQLYIDYAKRLRDANPEEINRYSDNESDVDVEAHLKEMENMYGELIQLRKIKYKDLEDMVRMGQIEKSLRDMKNGTIKLGEQKLEEFGRLLLVKFCNDNSLTIILHDPDYEKPVLSLVERLFKAFTRSNVIQFFDEYILSEDDHLNDTPSEFLSTELFTIPDLDSLTYSQLKIMRTEMMDSMKPFYKTVDVMQKEFSKVLYTDENLEYIETRTSELLAPHFEDVKKTMENSLYNQQIINSKPDTVFYTLHFCVSSIEMIVGFYEINDVLTFEEGELLLQQIALHKSIETCCFFFYNFSWIPDGKPVTTLD